MWYKKRVFYEVYIPSFADGNNDGIGDFKGLIGKLDYLKNLGVKGIWLTPFYTSPKVDNGYDISDYYNVDISYGTLNDFKRFLKEAHSRDIKVIADIVLNHTSDLHPWFLSSRESENSKYRDFYIWKKEIPNNWENFFTGSAWEPCTKTDSYYYHAFSKEQVCLNWTNPEVINEMKNVMEFWLNLGIDGFRLDVINFLKVNLQLFSQDNPIDKEGKQLHIFDQDQLGIIETIKDLVKFVGQWDDKLMVGEVGSVDLDILKNYIGEDLLDLVFNFNLGSIEILNVTDIYNNLVNMNNENIFPTLFFSSHDMPRHFTRLCGENKEIAKVFAGLMLLGLGAPFIYQGDELGMRDFYADNYSEIKDIKAKLVHNQILNDGGNENEALNKANEDSRDKSRSPMQWDSTEKNYGFSQCKPWMSISDNGIDLSQQIDDHSSLYEFYKKIIFIRNEHEIFQLGNYKEIKKVKDAIVFSRVYKENEIIVILNFSEMFIEYNKGESDYIFTNSQKNNNIIQPYEVSILKKGEKVE